MSAVRARREDIVKTVPASVPHFKDFADIADPRVRRAKEYEQVLQFALDKCPAEHAGRLKKELEWARTEQTRDQDADREAVFAAVKFPLTRAEIAEDLDLSASTIWKRLQELVKAGRVLEEKRPLQGNNRFVLIYRQNPVRP